MINLNTLLIISTLLLTTSAASAAYTTKPKPPPRRTPTDGVTYTVTNRAASNTPGGSVFTNHIGTAAAQQAMSSATHFIWNLFNQPVEAYCNNKNNEIHVNASYLGKYKGNIRREFVGIVYHQMAAVWQWNGKGEAPKGLLSGIAEFVRMAAHYGNSQKVRLGDGNRWDQGDGVTARFLEFCEKKKKGFVKELNKKMKYGYTKAYFFDFLGKTVDQLWKEYKAKYAKKY
ncbi:hypothetical protein LINGRAHAP2_LOCUS35655 [Linum grandiflorum]